MTKYLWFTFACALLVQDLTAIGITQPETRKRLTLEISRLRVNDGLPNHIPVSTRSSNIRLVTLLSLLLYRVENINLTTQ